MANEAAPNEGVESLDDGAELAGEATEPTTPNPDLEATWKRRIAGKDQALTASKKEAESLKSQLAEYQRKVADYEQASLSEVEKLQKRLAEQEARANAAEERALRTSLQAKYPLTFDLLGDRTPVDDESWLAEREGRLKTEAEPDEPIVDPNNPGRTRTKPADDSGDAILDRLRSFGNPFADLGAEVKVRLPEERR